MALGRFDAMSCNTQVFFYHWNRFLSGENTYKYTVAISNCSLTSCDNTSCLTFGHCSIRLSTRSQAFPSLTDNHTNTINCSISKDSSSTCFLVMEQPVASDWQYVMIECLQHGNMTLNVLILQEGEYDWLLSPVFVCFVIANFQLFFQEALEFWCFGVLLKLGEICVQSSMHCSLSWLYMQL